MKKRRLWFSVPFFVCCIAALAACGFENKADPFEAEGALSFSQEVLDRRVQKEAELRAIIAPAVAAINAKVVKTIFRPGQNDSGTNGRSKAVACCWANKELNDV